MKILKLEITEQNYQRAVQASSGACLVADAIKEQYPEFSEVKVDVATIRCTDRKAGERYIFLTPPSVVNVLLYFDQGLAEKELPKKLRIRNLVRVLPITRSASATKSRQEYRTKRLAELQAKVGHGETLSGHEKRALAQMQNYTPPERPTSYGPTTIEGKGDDIVIRGGDPTAVTGRVSQNKKNPNMLAGKTRHFGAKTAVPSQVFKDVLEASLEEATAKVAKAAAKEAVEAYKRNQKRKSNPDSTP